MSISEIGKYGQEPELFSQDLLFVTQKKEVVSKEPCEKTTQITRAKQECGEILKLYLKLLLESISKLEKSKEEVENDISKMIGDENILSSINLEKKNINPYCKENNFEAAMKKLAYIQKQIKSLEEQKNKIEQQN